MYLTRPFVAIRRTAHSLRPSCPIPLELGYGVELPSLLPPCFPSALILSTPASNPLCILTNLACTYQLRAQSVLDYAECIHRAGLARLHDCSTPLLPDCQSAGQISVSDSRREDEGS